MGVRDELQKTISAYQTLFESSVTFGMRKQLQAEQGMDELEARVKELEQKKAILTDKVVNKFVMLMVFRGQNQRIKLKQWKRYLKKGEIYLNKKEQKKRSS